MTDQVRVVYVSSAEKRAAQVLLKRSAITGAKLSPNIKLIAEARPASSLVHESD